MIQYDFIENNDILNMIVSITLINYRYYFNVKYIINIVTTIVKYIINIVLP